MRKNHLVLNRAIARYLGDAEQHGLRVTQETDFSALSITCEKIDGHALSEQFSGRYFDISPYTGFWLSVRDGAGEIVSIQAARIDNITGQSLADFWRQQQRRIYCDPYPDQAPALGEDHAPAAHKITGRVVYHGEMWLSPSWRGKGLGKSLCRLGQLLAFAKWDLDYIYCYISKALVHKGFAADQGYVHVSPMGTHWVAAPAHIPDDDFLCWNTPEDLQHLAKTSSE